MDHLEDEKMELEEEERKEPADKQTQPYYASMYSSLLNIFNCASKN